MTKKAALISAAFFWSLKDQLAHMPQLNLPSMIESTSATARF